jgi:hypothetical protein
MFIPIDLQTAIVTTLQAIPDLVDFVGSSDWIAGYDDDNDSQIAGTPDIAELGMMGRAVMVVWTGADLPKGSEVRGARHRFRILLKADSIQAYQTLVYTILNGIPQQPVGDGTTAFVDFIFDPGYDRIQDIEVKPELPKDGVTRLSITFAVWEVPLF